MRCSLTLFSFLFIFCGDGFIYSFLEYNCGTVLSESAVQHEPAVSIHTPHCLLSLPPGCIPPLWAVTEHQAEFPLAQGNLPLALCLYLGFVYRAVLLSRFMPPSPPPTTRLSVLCVCSSIPALQIASSVPFFRFHIHVLIYDICFSDLLHSV